MTVKVGSIWGTTDRKRFVVTDVKFEDTGTWVYYSNIETQVQYFCLVDAFKTRFSEIINEYTR